MLLPQLLVGINNIEFWKVICFQTIIILINSFLLLPFYIAVQRYGIPSSQCTLGQDNTVEADVNYVKWYLPSCPSKTAKGMEILAMPVSPVGKSVSLREKLIASLFFGRNC